MTFFRRKKRQPRKKLAGITITYVGHDPERDGIAPSSTTLRKYGITAEQYIRMFREQNGGCYICGRPPRRRRLSIDHCHRNPLKIRGLLCPTHNYALGMFRDNVEHLAKAAEYLRREPPITLQAKPTKTVGWNTTRLEMPDEYYAPGRDRYACAFPETKEYDEYDAADGDPE